MRLGDQLNGYEIVTPPTNAGGGMSQWAFARKDGEEYFLKMFLAPKFPLDTGPGSPESKARKRAACIEFEQRHLQIAGRIDPAAPGGGNLVVAREFFRVESTYVKVMDKVEAVELPTPTSLTGQQVLVILRSLAFSLRMLHEKQIVHGDLKPDNVMLQRAGTNLYTSKLIDFDEAYIVGNPPSPERIVGDPSYYSPELLRYIKNDERLPNDALTTASDMFSLGLLLHALLTGDQPLFDRSHCNYPAEALLHRMPLDITNAPDVLHPLLSRMLALVPSERPTIEELVEFLATVDPAAVKPKRSLTKADRPVGMPPAATTPTPASPRPRSPHSPVPMKAPTPPPAVGTGLRSTMGRKSRPGASPTEPT